MLTQGLNLRTNILVYGQAHVLKMFNFFQNVKVSNQGFMMGPTFPKNLKKINTKILCFIEFLQ